MKPHAYQLRAVDFVLSRLYSRGDLGAGLFLDPGLGKTSITLHVIDALRAMEGRCRTLVIAPLRVVYGVWPDEVRKWGFDLECSIVHGSPAARRKALEADADLYLINPEGVEWLEANLGRHRFDLVVVDESTKFKSWGAKRSKALRKLLRASGDAKRLILTGTPTPNGYADLFSQVYLLDEGATLGRTQTFFRRSFCTTKLKLGKYPDYVVTEGGRRLIEDAIAPMTLRLAAEDYLDMPELIEVPVRVDLPPDIARKYRRLERELILELANAETLVASGAGALYSLCRGVANGGGYQYDGPDGSRRSIPVHYAKVDAVADIVEELWGKPVLVFYQFHHDAERLLERFHGAPVLRGGLKPDECNSILERWNRGEIPVLLAQPQSVSHGLNMQAGGNNIVWFGLPDSLETYLQANARLWRQGVVGGVRVFQVVANSTVDEAIAERLRNKDEAQRSLLETLKLYAERPGELWTTKT